MHQIFHSPFYCYPTVSGSSSPWRSTGATRRRAKLPGRLLKLLSYGGSAPPQQILEEAGIDMLSIDFWRGGYKVIEDRIAELEALEG